MVKPDKANAKILFDKKVHYEIPAFQRPYVWNVDDQWEPLWDDIARVAESHLAGVGRKPIDSHFMGAVVFELTEATSTGVDRFDVIDGQQRLTTLQILLDAAQEMLVKRGHKDEADSLEELILNGQDKFKGAPERFKLWPSMADRDAFENAMDPTAPAPASGSQITKAHEFFRTKVERWLDGTEGEDGEPTPGDEPSRAAQLCETLIRRLTMVTIDLSEEDDPQLIFETLNDRGTPLLKADLIKNWVFREGKKLGADVDIWATTIWNDFDTEWWRTEIAQGRLSRSRVDIFLQYWLTLRTLDEVKSELVFRLFTEHAATRMITAGDAEAFLLELRADANTYRNLTALDATTAPGRFRIQVIEAMELAATMPVFLWFLSTNHAVPNAQVAVGLGALESWATRRTLLRLTSKDVNRFMIAILKELSTASVTESGNLVRNYLSEQTAESRYWPSDDEISRTFPGMKVYGQIKQSRLRAILGAVELRRRSLTTKHEDVPVPSGLSVEHVMPQEWRAHWDEEPPLDPDASRRRDTLVNSIGNLTLTTQSLNSSLSNRPWTDAAAKGFKVGGQAGKGKRSLLQSFSLLVLNKDIIDSHVEAWTESDITARAKAIARDIVAIWPGPDMRIQADASERTRDGKGEAR